MRKPTRSGQSWASNKLRKKKYSRRRGSEKKSKNFLKGLWSKKWDRASLIKNLFLLAIALFLFGAIIFLGLFAWLSRDLPDPNSLSSREVAQSTKIYDRTGEILLYEISGDEKRTLVTMEQVPEYLKWATITAEDRKFYSHSGIDVKGILRAIFRNVTTLDPTGEGGSTITQQLVKNAILTTEQTYTRKIKEIVLALALERRYTKDEILQLYLNEIPYGSTNYGVESAARAYFGKHVEDLTIAEAATVAALPQAPSTFLNNPDRLKERRDWIINSMADLDYITDQERDAALAEESGITVTLAEIEAPHFVLWVKEQLEEEYGQRVVEQGGLNVITSLSLDMQIIAEEAVVANKEARGESLGFNNSGFVAIDPKTGHILAMVGSADYFDDDIDGQVNVTTRPLQPGSSFKPIVYAAAFELGYTPNSILWDVNTNFPTATGNYSPKNYDFSEHGPVTIRKALQGSLNIPAVKALYLVGVDRALDFAERFHYSTFEDRSNFGLAIVLGGAEVKLIDHVSAYATFANEGIYHEPIAILRVEEPNGDVLQEWKEEDSQGERVVEANIANLVSNVLSDNAARAYAFGTNTPLVLPGRPVAAKTGTTNDYKDGWTIGYTPSLAAGVWTGNTDGHAMNRGSGGSSAAAPIWNEFMRRALEGQTVDYFNSPSIPETGVPILDGQMPMQEVTIDTASGKLATEHTPERFKETKQCGEFHSILHYVEKNNPLSGKEGGSQNDPYYESWENAIQDFITRSNEELEEGEVPLKMCEIPTEEDDVHVPANQPQVSINTPRRNDEVGRQFPVQVSANAPRGINRLEYKVDNQTIQVDFNPTGTTLSLPGWVGIGSHSLTVIAYDDVDNQGSTEITIRVTQEGSGSEFNITNPFNHQEIEKTETTYNIAIEYSSSETLRSVILTAQNLWTGQTSLIGEAQNVTSMTSITWTLPEAGQYLLNARAITSSGQTIESTPISVLVKDLATEPPDLLGEKEDEEE